MSVDIGRDRYEVIEGFFQRPKGWTFIEVADVDVDADDNVYVLNRGSHPVMIFDREGRFLDAWGEFSRHYFTFPHGLSVGIDGHVYTADSRDHTIRKWTLDGKPLLTLGTVNIPATLDGGKPFHRPSHATVARNGDIYAADGHGNAMIHCFSPDGTLKFSWGSRGSGPGQFDTVHSVFIDHDDDTIYAADRYNDRVQRFDLAGTYLGEWGGFDWPQSVRKGPDGTFHVAELNHRITIVDGVGAVLARWGGGVDVDPADGRVPHDPGPGLFGAPHGIAVDSQGAFYVADVSESWKGLDRGSRAIQKFVPK